MDKIEMVMLGMIVVLLGVSFASAGLGDWLRTITGKAASDTTDINVTLGNTAPRITDVTAVAAPTLTIDGVKYITVNYTVTDDDGEGDINLTNAQVRIQASGEESTTNSSCDFITGENWTDNRNFTCTFGLNYFAGNVAFTINATATDNSSATAENSTTTVTPNLLTAMTMYPTSLAWATLTTTSTNVGADDDPIRINNSGNDDITNISVTAIDLRGETTATRFIYAPNFTANWSDGADGTNLVNGTPTQVDSALLTANNHTVNNGSHGQRDVFFYIEAVNSDLTSQSYSSLGGAWTVAIIT